MTKAKGRSRSARDTRSAVARAIAGRLEQNRLAWAQRHPATAADQRAARLQNAATLERWKHKNAGMPETHERASRRQEGSLARLYKAGGIDGEQFASAVEIAAIAEHIGADVTVKTASLETRVDVTRMGDGTFYERPGQVRREVAYTRWRGALQLGGHLVAAVLDTVVGESRDDGTGPGYSGEPLGFSLVAARYGMHHRKAKRLLIHALDLWPEILGYVRREVADRGSRQDRCLAWSGYGRRRPGAWSRGAPQRKSNAADDVSAVVAAMSAGWSYFWGPMTLRNRAGKPSALCSAAIGTFRG